MSTPILKAHGESYAVKFGTQAQKQSIKQEYLNGFKKN